MHIPSKPATVSYNVGTNTIRLGPYGVQLVTDIHLPTPCVHDLTRADVAELTRPDTKVVHGTWDDHPEVNAQLADVTWFIQANELKASLWAILDVLTVHARYKRHGTPIYELIRSEAFGDTRAIYEGGAIKMFTRNPPDVDDAHMTFAGSDVADLMNCMGRAYTRELKHPRKTIHGFNNITIHVDTKDNWRIHHAACPRNPCLVPHDRTAELMRVIHAFSERTVETRLPYRY